MGDEKKISAPKRRELILQWLTCSDTPLTGTELSTRTGVSRQIIVQDISFLKSQNSPIVATSQGYIYLHTKYEIITRTICCNHTPQQTSEEMNTLVDYGVKIKDVTIEHPIYGDLTASIMVSTRQEVEEFLKKIEETNSVLLSQLTGGTHLHTLEADSSEKLDEVCRVLLKKGILVS